MDKIKDEKIINVLPTEDDMLCKNDSDLVKKYIEYIRELEDIKCENLKCLNILF